jgi:crossover junction endodeoxyribonuclease RuvC
MRVLGVDPGLTRCGLGVVDGMPGRPLVMVSHDVARSSPEAGIGERLLAIEQQIEEWLDTYRPDAVAVERVFSQHNVRTVMGTAQAGAVAIVCAARRGIPVALHTPSEVKAAVTGSGRADKAQVTAMVTRLLRLADAPRPADAADALALAICHIWRGGAQARLAAAQAQAALARTTPAGLRRITPSETALDQAALDQAELDQAELDQGALDQGALKQAALQQAALKQAALQQAALKQARRNGAAVRRAALEQAALEHAMTRQTGRRQAGGPR